MTPSGVVLGLYSICSLAGVFTLFYGNYTQPFDDKYWLPMLFFDLFIIIFLLPFRIFNESGIRVVRLPSRSFLDVFSTIIIILSLFSIVFYGSSVRNIFSMASLGDARNDMVGGELYFEKGISATVGSVAAANYVFAIMLYFIYKIIGNSKTRCALLLISSFSESIQVLSFVGRDGIVFWIFTVMYLYAFFRPFVTEDTEKKLLRKAVIIIAIISIPFFLITISRFGSGGSGSSIVSYLGQGFINAPLFFGLESKPIDIGSRFPLFYELTGTRMPSGSGPVVIGDWVSWQFSTIVVGLYRSLDLMGLIIVTIIMYCLFRLVTRNVKQVINLGQLTFYMLYFQIIGEGVFYFKHATRGGNLFILTTLMLAIFFSFATKTSAAKIVLNRVR